MWLIHLKMVAACFPHFILLQSTYSFHVSRRKVLLLLVRNMKFRNIRDFRDRNNLQQCNSQSGSNYGEPSINDLGLWPPAYTIDMLDRARCLHWLVCVINQLINHRFKVINQADLTPGDLEVMASLWLICDLLIQDSVSGDILNNEMSLLAECRKVNLKPI